MAEEFKGGFVFSVMRTDISPQGYDPLEKIEQAGGIGQAVAEIKTTNFESTAQEYIGNLPDGSDFSLTCNRVHITNSCQDYLDATVGQVLTVRATLTRKDVSPNTVRRMDFTVLNKGSSLDPAFEDKNKITFNFKITGAITRTSTAA